MNIIIVVPAYNEEKIIEHNVSQLYRFCRKYLSSYQWKIVIADNHSSDMTDLYARRLAGKYAEIEYLFVEKRGKGAAVMDAWNRYQSDIYCFLDADLATDLRSLPDLISAVAGGKYDIACGSRFLPGAQVQRTLLRRFTSWGYRLFVRAVIHTNIHDLPCGFKAVNRRVKQEILPEIKSRGWFFDSELLLLAEHAGFQIKEIPVQWREPQEDERKSKVKILSLSLEYIKEVFRLRRRMKSQNNNH